jgi:hypothetical protein
LPVFRISCVMLRRQSEISKLCAKVTVAFDGPREFSGRHKCRHLAHERISAVFVDIHHETGLWRLPRVLDIFSPFASRASAGADDGVERVLVHDGVGHHHHAGDPEEQDVLARDPASPGSILRVQACRLASRACQARGQRRTTSRRPGS